MCVVDSYISLSLDSNLTKTLYFQDILNGTRHGNDIDIASEVTHYICRCFKRTRFAYIELLEMISAEDIPCSVVFILVYI